MFVGLRGGVDPSRLLDPSLLSELVVLIGPLFYGVLETLLVVGLVLFFGAFGLPCSW